PPSPFDEPPAMNRTAPTLEDIPAPAILSSGYARPTDPEISISSESMPTKETPVYAEEPEPEPEAPLSEESGSTGPVKFEPSDAEEEAAAAEVQPPAVEEEPVKESTYDLGPLPESSEQGSAEQGLAAADIETS